MYFLVYFGMYFFTRVFHACFSCGICVQYGRFPLMKHACNAAMPAAWPVLYALICFHKTQLLAEPRSFVLGKQTHA